MIAAFTCDHCGWDGDTEYRYLHTHTPEIAWDCPACGRESDGELEEEDPDRWR